MVFIKSYVAVTDLNSVALGATELLWRTSALSGIRKPAMFIRSRIICPLILMSSWELECKLSKVKTKHAVNLKLFIVTWQHLEIFCCQKVTALFCPFLRYKVFKIWTRFDVEGQCRQAYAYKPKDKTQKSEAGKN